MRIRPQSEAPFAHSPGSTLQSAEKTNGTGRTTRKGTFPVEIVDVSDEGVKVDANHPLAGMDLTFELTLVEVG